ncbi:lipopolysaccharide biosynthesis protein [Salipiger sp.]|uniref:lipopolysaccharide biosynthesis protein n=1 Tax=Salipiger sp. TaxID=2078585 RepID=UPI003A97FF1D
MAAAGGGSALGGTLQKALSLVGARVLGNVLTLGYTLILARLTTPTEFGLIMTAFAWIMLLSVFLALNLESGSIKYLVQYRESGQPGRAAGFIRLNRMTIFGLTLLSGLVAALAWWGGAFGDGAAMLGVVAVTVVAAPVVALTRVYGRHASALGQVLRGGVPIMLVRPAVIFLLVALIWLSGARPGLTVYLLLFLAAFTVTALVQALLLRQTFGFAAGVPREYDEARRWFATGAMMAPLLVLRDNLKHVVVAAAGLVLVPAEVGYLALALSIMAFVYFAMKAVDISISPQLSRALHAGQTKRVASLLDNAARLKIAGMLAGTVMIAGFGGMALELFGPEYRASLAPLLILLIIPASDAVFGPAQIVLNVTGRQDVIFWVAGISTVIMVGATALGGVLDGATGAALGAALSYAVQQLILRSVAKTSAGTETSIIAVFQRESGK